MNQINCDEIVSHCVPYPEENVITATIAFSDGRVWWVGLWIVMYTERVEKLQAYLYKRLWVRFSVSYSE